MGIYWGPRQTLLSTLSAEECLQRLHTQVGEAHVPFSSLTRWRPLAVDSAVWRKVRGNHFWLYTERAYSRNRWYFYGHVQAHDAATSIAGRYRTHTALWVMLGLALLYGLYLISGSMTGAMVFVIGRGGGWEYLTLNKALILGLGVPALLLGMFALHGFLFRKKHHLEEQQLLACIKQVCVAEESR